MTQHNNLAQRMCLSGHQSELLDQTPSLTCPLYAESRRNLSIRLDNYSINQLLYGIEDSTLQENKSTTILTSCGRFNQLRERSLTQWLLASYRMSVKYFLSLSISLSISLSLSLSHLYT